MTALYPVQFPIPSWEYFLAVVAAGVGCAVGVYFATRQVPMVMATSDSDDEGDVIVLQPSRADGWLQRATDAVGKLDGNIEDTGEGFRQRLLERGLDAPAHANQWGSLFMTLTRRRVLVPTGEYRAMLAPSSHGRRTAVYALRKDAA